MHSAAPAAFSVIFLVSRKRNDADADLFALIRKKNSMRAEQAEGMFAALEAKYANPKKKTKK